MEHREYASRFLTGQGVEIGAFTTPIPGIRPIYVDRFPEYAGEKTLADYYGDACDLPFHACSLGYVATSHVLEHVANPLAALAEWFRVLEHDGIIYMVIPDISKTFDHKRQLSSVEHMLEDYENNVTQVDGTHIDEFVFGVDWKTYSPSTPVDQLKDAQEELASVYHHSIAAGSEINIHFHTFNSESARQLIEVGNRENIWNGKIDIVEVVESFPGSNPNGFLIIARVAKSMSTRLKAKDSPKGLTENARKF